MAAVVTNCICWILHHIVQGLGNDVRYVVVGSRVLHFAVLKTWFANKKFSFSVFFVLP